MLEKLFEIVNGKPKQFFWLGEKKINILYDGNKFFITSLYIEDNECIVRYVINGEPYTRSSFTKDMSKPFIAQLLSEIL